MRGTVTRDTYRNDIITSRPSAEVATRLGKQLAKLCQALAILHQRNTVTDDDYRLIRKVMLDTVPQRTEDLFRNILLTCPTEEDTISTSLLSTRTHYPGATVSRIVQDLTVLEIAKRVTDSKIRSSSWSLSGYIRKLVKDADLYQTEEELKRSNGRLMIRTVQRKKLKAKVAQQPQGEA